MGLDEEIELLDQSIKLKAGLNQSPRFYWSSFPKYAELMNNWEGSSKNKEKILAFLQELDGNLYMLIKIIKEDVQSVWQFKCDKLNSDIEDLNRKLDSLTRKTNDFKRAFEALRVGFFEEDEEDYD